MAEGRISKILSSRFEPEGRYQLFSFMKSRFFRYLANVLNTFDDLMESEMISNDLIKAKNQHLQFVWKLIRYVQKNRDSSIAHMMNKLLAYDVHCVKVTAETIPAP